VKEIPLTRGYTALVDYDDYNWLKQYKWCANSPKLGRTIYVVSRIGGKLFYMHTLIMQPEKGFEVHHKDGNGWNNQRNNLEIVTHAVNSRYMPIRHGKYRGVYAHQGKFMVKVYINYKSIYIGIYKTEREAALAYNEAAIRLLGINCPLNILE
jgi:hypothetical protein